MGKGIDNIIKNIKAFGKDTENHIDVVIKQTAEEIKANAKINAPINNGKLNESILSEKTEGKKLSYSIYVGGVARSYAPFVEFGTGKQVSVPPELKKIASQFKGKGGGFEKGLQSIKDWCKNKGIDEKMAFPIFMSILKKGLKPRPFLYPAFLKGKKILKQDLKDLLEDLTKKHNG